MNLYAESSAVVSWLFGEARADEVTAALRRARLVLASELTPVECDRVLARARSLEILTARETARRRRLLERAASAWHLLPVDAPILDRARQPFPREPLRTLDAIHLATALDARPAVPDLVLLSLDRRIRANGRGLGLRLEPARD